MEKTGFENSGYIQKKGTPSGEGAKFNYLPPDPQNIFDQKCADLRNLPMKEIVSTKGYPGDGWD